MKEVRSDGEDQYQNTRTSNRSSRLHPLGLLKDPISTLNWNNWHCAKSIALFAIFCQAYRSLFQEPFKRLIHSQYVKTVIGRPASIIWPMPHAEAAGNHLLLAQFALLPASPDFMPSSRKERRK